MRGVVAVWNWVLTRKTTSCASCPLSPGGSIITSAAAASSRSSFCCCFRRNWASYLIRFFADRSTGCGGISKDDMSDIGEAGIETVGWMPTTEEEEDEEDDLLLEAVVPESDGIGEAVDLVEMS